jgi:hypothetical protein
MIQVHLTAALVPDDIPVRLNDYAEPFVLITLGPVELSLHSRGECDALTAAVQQARNMLPEDLPGGAS